MKRGVLVGSALALAALISTSAPEAGGDPGTAAPSPRCHGRLATIVGSPGVPTFGTPGPDVIVGAEGAPVDGMEGNDLICGRGDANRIHGSEGADVLLGGYRNDVIFGGPGTDTIRGQSGSDHCTESPQDSVAGCAR